MPLTPMQNNTQESWEERFDEKFKDSFTLGAMESWEDGKVVKSFIRQLLQKQAEEISEAVGELLKTPKYNEAQTYDLGIKHAIATIQKIKETLSA